ncbi:hypothetical protein [uncultured Dokdonia sp.]|uniref:hypothetical protein n=1 Tax=uncultured Dokdonia sp. TaxID=575653 RepID=UPI00260BABC5|nr:hypothetical protein [uncultured Dokdonia sp.]
MLYFKSVVEISELHNIREVQYMAGHRYISSTERFLQDDIENLQEMIDNLHPINLLNEFSSLITGSRNIK